MATEVSEDLAGAVLVHYGSPRESSFLRKKIGLSSPSSVLYLNDSSGERVYVPAYEFRTFASCSRLPDVLCVDALPDYDGDFATALVALLRRDPKPVLVSAFCPAWLYERLRTGGIDVKVREYMFVRELLIKDRAELEVISSTATVVRRGFERIEEWLAASQVCDGQLWLDGAVLTSTTLLRRVSMFLAESDVICDPGVIACGKYGFEPHSSVEHVLLAHEPIIVDLACKHIERGFYIDVSRTYCKGSPRHAPFSELYGGVLGVKTQIEADLRAGAVVADVVREAERGLAALGVTVTESVAKVLESEGAICHHAFGHGIGLDLHQPPLLGRRASVPVRAGMCFAIEPGAYLRGLGGVRLEDTVVVTPHGCDNLTRSEYRFVIE